MFWTRLLSGAVLLVIAFASFWVGAPLLPVVLYAVSLIGFLELTKALGVREKETKGISAPEIVGVAAVTVYYGLLLLRDVCVLEGERLFYIMSCIIFLFLGELLVYVLAFPKFQAESVMASIFAFLYAPVMLSFIDLTRMHTDGIQLVWLILISAWGCDSCAYCVGKLVGRKKIFPHLSPKKTLEGCIGGVVGAGPAGSCFCSLYGIQGTEGALPDSGYLRAWGRCRYAGGPGGFSHKAEQGHQGLRKADTGTWRNYGSL